MLTGILNFKILEERRCLSVTQLHSGNLGQQSDLTVVKFCESIGVSVNTYYEEWFGDNHKVKLDRKRSKTNGVGLGKMASGLWVSLGAPAACGCP